MITFPTSVYVEAAFIFFFAGVGIFAIFCKSWQLFFYWRAKVACREAKTEQVDQRLGYLKDQLDRVVKSEINDLRAELATQERALRALTKTGW